jgi:hypothetical protein
MMRRTLRFAPLALALLVSACGSNSSTTTSPSTSNGLTTDTFNGTVAVKGSDSKNFTVTVTGVVSVTLTAAPVPLTLSVGLPGGNGCAPIAGATQLATPGALAQVAGEVTPGTYCVLLADPGTLTAAAAYTVTVNHP